MSFKSHVTANVVIRSVLVGMAGLLVQIPTAAQLGDNMPQAFRFIDAVYPGLRSKGVVSRAEGYVYPKGPWFFREFAIRIADSERDIEEDYRGLDGLGKVYFKGSFQFGEAGEAGLEHFSAAGRFVRFQDNQDFVKGLAHNNTWSEAEISRELTRLGGRYGPDARTAIAAVAPSVRVVAAIGQVKPLAMSDITFQIPVGRERHSGQGAGSVAWHVTYISASGRRRIQYAATIEPFEGRLISLFRVGIDLPPDASRRLPESRNDAAPISPPTQDKPQVWFPTPGPHEGAIVPDAVVRVRIDGQSPDTDRSIPEGVRQVRHTVTVLDVYTRQSAIAAGSVKELRQSERLDRADGQNSSIQEILPVGTEWILELWWNSRQAAYWIVNGSGALEVRDGRVVRHSDYPLIRKWDGCRVEEVERVLRDPYASLATAPKCSQ